MEIALTPEMEAAIRAQLANGKFASVEEVVTEGLRLIAEGELDRTRAMVEVGWLESERGLSFSAEDARDELAKRRALRLDQRKAS